MAVPTFISINNASSTFYDNEFRGNTASSNYGGLYFYAENQSQVTGANLVVADNTAGSSYGGAYVYADYQSTILLPDTDITGNTSGSSYGGGYFEAYDNSVIEIPDVYVFENTAGSSYGGLSLDAADGSDTIIATNAQVISNTASSGSGGGGYADLEDAGFIDLTGSSFQYNTSTSNGGGLYVSDVYNGSTLLLGNTEFLTNTAGSNGGGIYFSNGPNYGAYVDMSYATFISNTATTSGGGFYMDEQYYNVYGEVSTKADHNTYIRNTAINGDGGGFYLDEAYEGARVLLDDSVIEENYAGGDGGGAYVYECYSGCYLSFSRSVFEDNEAGQDGGAVYHDYTEYGSEAYFDDNTYTDNIAGGDGGAFYVDGELAYDGSFVSFSRNTFIGNEADGDGGAVYFAELAYDGGSVLFNDNWIEDNFADGYGGGVYVDDYVAYEGSIVEMNRNTVISNTATSAGGGLYLYDVNYGSTLYFQNNVVTGNVISSTIGYAGGGIYMYTINEGSTVYMTDNVINDNVATSDGGGFFIDDYIDYGSTLYFENNELQRNFAGDSGGGCYFDDTIDDGSRIYFNNNLINDNVAQSEAGACYVYEIDTGSIVEMTGNEFNYNTAADDYGALYFDGIIEGSLMHFWDNQVIGNRAGISNTTVLGGDAGGIYLEDIDNGGEVDFRNNQVLSNTAYLSGTTGGEYGGIYANLDSGGLLTMVDNEIAGNSAQASYGGFYVYVDESQLDMTGNLIQANTAITMSGGLAIYGQNDGQYYLQRNQILDNSAGMAGGLSIENGDATDPLWGLSENNLIAGNQGSGVYLLDADFYSTNDTIGDNGAYGVMMTGTVTSTAYLTNLIVWGHTDSFLFTDVITYTDRFTVEASYSDIEGSWPGMGNIDSDPLFVGSGDYHLQEASPAVDTGTNDGAPAVDLDGVPRPVNAITDMGAYEFRLTGVTVTGDGAVSADPGMMATHVVTITNTGNGQDMYALTLSGNVWTSTLSTEMVTVNAGESVLVDVYVDVPAGALEGEMDQVTVNAESQVNAQVADSDVLDTVANQVAGVSLSPDNDAVAEEGRYQLYQHTVENTGNGSDTFDITVSSDLGWTVQALPASITLNAGETRTVLIRVDVPLGSVGQTNTTTVTATSMYDNGVSDTAVDTTTSVLVAPYHLNLPLIIK